VAPFPAPPFGWASPLRLSLFLRREAKEERRIRRMQTVSSPTNRHRPGGFTSVIPVAAGCLTVSSTTCLLQRSPLQPGPLLSLRRSGRPDEGGERRQGDGSSQAVAVTRQRALLPKHHLLLFQLPLAVPLQVTPHAPPAAAPSLNGGSARGEAAGEARGVEGRRTQQTATPPFYSRLSAIAAGCSCSSVLASISSLCSSSFPFRPLNEVNLTRQQAPPGTHFLLLHSSVCSFLVI
jgi:hypothetical protein